MTPHAPREPPHRPVAPLGRPAPCEPPLRKPMAQFLQPSAAWESSAAPGRASPQEAAPIAVEMLLCPTNKNITYIKQKHNNEFK
jgi:hypothetical protein